MNRMIIHRAVLLVGFALAMFPAADGRAAQGGDRAARPRRAAPPARRSRSPLRQLGRDARLTLAARCTAGHKRGDGDRPDPFRASQTAATAR